MILKDRLYDVHRKVYEIIPQGINNILDIGCQWGKSTQFYTKKVNLVIGLDSQKEFLINARQANSTFKIVNAFAESLPFKDSSLECVLMSEVLGQTTDELACVKEAYRVLRPEGKLIIASPYKGLFYFLGPDNFKFYFPKAFSRLYHMLKEKSPQKSKMYSKDRDQIHQFTLLELKSLLGSRFNVIKIHRGGFLIYPISVWINYLFNTFSLKCTQILGLVNSLCDIEYRINFGRAAYNILVVAAKV